LGIICLLPEIFAAPYALVTCVVVNGNCKIYEITIYEDNNTSDPRDDKKLTTFFIRQEGC
jgi:hypothetical protein